MEHPHLPEFTTSRALTGDVDEYYPEQAKNDKQIRLKALRERENEGLLGKWDRDEYMNKVNWPEKNRRKDTKLKCVFCIRIRLRRIGSCGVVGLLRESRQGTKM